MAQDKNLGFEIITEDQVKKVPRGRKSSVDPALVAGLRTVKVGQIIKVTTMQCVPASKDYGKDKARVSATLRSALKQAGFKQWKIEWSPEGVPQVKINS